MTVFKSAYETTIGTGLHTKNIALQLRQVLVSSLSSSTFSGDQEPYLESITGKDVSHASVPVFVHPYLVDGIDKKNYLFIDYRPFVKIDSVDKWDPKVIIKNTVEYNFAKARLLINKVLLTQGSGSLSGLSSLPMGVFASWISEAVTHRFALDMSEQVKLTVLACIYYQTLFVENEDLDEQMLNVFKANAIRVLKIPATIVYEVTDNIPLFTNIKSLCEVIKTKLENSRLEDFNEGVLITMLKNTWYGSNAAEILAVALEHTPTWVSLVYTSISERTFKNSTIAKITERYSKGGAGEAFQKSFVTLALSVDTEIK